MRWQRPGNTTGFSKLEQARRLAAALAYIALANLDAVNVFYFSGDVQSELRVLRGKGQFHRVLEFLREDPAKPQSTNLSASIRTFTQQVKRRGLVFVLSDFFDPAGYEEGINLLRHAQFQARPRGPRRLGL